MTMKIKGADGSLHTITSAFFKDGTTLRRLVRVKMLDGATLRTLATFVEPLTVSISPSPAIEDGPGGFTASVSANVTATPSGGLGPYTYSWAHVSGDTLTVTNATSATATLSASLPAGGTAAAVYRVTCTDDASQTATADVSVALYNPTI